MLMICRQCVALLRTGLFPLLAAPLDHRVRPLASRIASPDRLSPSVHGELQSQALFALAAHSQSVSSSASRYAVNFDISSGLFSYSGLFPPERIARLYTPSVFALLGARTFHYPVIEPRNIPPYPASWRKTFETRPRCVARSRVIYLSLRSFFGKTSQGE